MALLRQKKKLKKVGLPPGSVIFTGNKKVEKIAIHYLQFDNESVEESEFDNHTSNVYPQSPEEKVDWYDVRGLHDATLIEKLGKTFTIHPLILEDIADVHQRPKYEEYEHGNFISLRALSFNGDRIKVQTEQVTLYFRKGLVLTFQEQATDLFQTVRDRIIAKQGRIRNKGADYLAYALVDAIVDHYYTVLEEIEGKIEQIEDELVGEKEVQSKKLIHQLKKQVIVLRKSVFPLRESIGRMTRSESELIDDRNMPFIRDLYDHVIQIMDSVENYRDMLNGLQDLYISEVSFRMNQVMQVLTLVASIFIPLTFLAGIYGMNFEYIPELKYKYAYFILLGTMLVIGLSLLYYFKKKRWL